MCVIQLQKLLFSATLSHDPEKLNQLRLFQPLLFTSVVKCQQSDVVPSELRTRHSQMTATDSNYLRYFIMFTSVIFWHIISVISSPDHDGFRQNTSSLNVLLIILLCTEMVKNPEPEAEADFVGKYTTPVGLSVSYDLHLVQILIYCMTVYICKKCCWYCTTIFRHQFIYDGFMAVICWLFVK